MAACASAAPWIGATLPLTTTTLPEPLSTEQLTESLYTIARVLTATKGQLALAEEVCLEILGHQPYHSDAKAKLKLVRALINKSLAAAVEEEQTQHEPKSLGDCDTVLSPAPAPAPGAPAFAPVAAAPLAPDPAHAAAGPQPPPSASGPSPPPLPAKEEFSSDTAQAPGASSFGSGTTETLAGIGSKFDSELMSKRKEALMQDCPALNPPSMMQAVLTKQADVLVEEVLAQAGPQFEACQIAVRCICPGIEREPHREAAHKFVLAAHERTKDSRRNHDRQQGKCAACGMALISCKKKCPAPGGGSSNST